MRHENETISPVTSIASSIVNTMSAPASPRF
jgi:hypothetical protein